MPGDAEAVRAAFQRNRCEADAAAERKGQFRAVQTTRWLNVRETEAAGNVRRIRACVHKWNTHASDDTEIVRASVQRNGREADAAAEKKRRLRAALTTRRLNARGTDSSEAGFDWMNR